MPKKDVDFLSTIGQSGLCPSPATVASVNTRVRPECVTRLFPTVVGILIRVSPQCAPPFPLPPARHRESLWARQPVPSSQDYQTVGEHVVSPNRQSLAGTTFGASSRPVLSPVNHTAQGRLAGFAMHRRTSSLSPRPGPGAHTCHAIDSMGRSLWVQSRAPVALEKERLKAKINLLNVRLSGDLGFESTSSRLLKEVGRHKLFNHNFKLNACSAENLCFGCVFGPLAGNVFTIRSAETTSAE